MNVRGTFRHAMALITVLFLFSVMAPLSAAAGRRQDGLARIDARVLSQTTQGDATVLVRLRQKADLGPAAAIAGWAARGNFVVKQLQSVADTSQAGIRALLQTQGVRFQYFWIVNAILVTADDTTIKQLATRPEVAEIVPSQTYQIPEPIPGKDEATVNAVEWGIDRIGAPLVWSTFGVRGEDIVVGSIDTGVQFNHPALVQQYRGNLGGGNFDHNYNWFDPSNVCGNPSLVPCDNNNHGTHTVGTMVGDDGNPGPNQIGVAPGARWIAAKGCESSSCSTAALLASMQWMLAPTNLQGQNPRPDLRPHIVNNSWGSNDGSATFYRSTVQAWVAAGIFPAFANGNNGPGCGTVGSPGSYVESYGVGAFDSNNVIASFSSRGASPLGGGIKPNLAAPGVNVRSSVVGNGYASFNGTSMATPHLAGAVALMWAAAPLLLGDIAATRALLDQTAIDTSDLQCGGTAANNNVFGEGRMDAFAAVDQAPRGPTGTLQGEVRDANSQPIAGATVRAVSSTLERTTTTNAAGGYSLVLPTGVYTATVTAFGYLPDSASGIVINTGATTTRNFVLAVAPTHTVSGVVRDSSGAPLANATVTILDTPLPPATTNASGAYSVANVPAGTYQARGTAGRCNGPQTQPLVVDGAETLNFTLPARSDDFGYSCRIVPANLVDANTVLPLTGDDAATTVSLPFAFPFYDQTYTTAYVATNGYLNFLASNSPHANGSIPSTGTPNAAIYPFWDDLVVDLSASVRTQLLGTAPNRAFVIEWRNVYAYNDTSKRLRIEVVLYENGQILTQYADLAADGREQGNSATIGIENPAGTVGLQYSFNEATLGAPAFAVLYRAPLRNVIANSGFELDANTDTFPDSWSTNLRFTRSNAAAHSGGFAGRHLAADNATYVVYQGVPASAGAYYIAGCWVNIPGTTDSFAFYVAVQWRDAGNGVISTRVIRADTAQTSGWSQTAVPLLAPAGTAYALVVMVAVDLNATIYVDDFTLSRL